MLVCSRLTASKHSFPLAPSHFTAIADSLPLISSPGPGGSRRMYPFDHRAASNSSLGHRYHTGSNTSIDGQLARDFQAHASLAVHPGSGPFASSTSGGYGFVGTSVSGPTTPYGNPSGHAVSSGNGFGRPVHPPIPSLFREHTLSDHGLDGQGNHHVRTGRGHKHLFQY
jgi:hypothetical protein